LSFVTVLRLTRLSLSPFDFFSALPFAKPPLPVFFFLIRPLNDLFSQHRFPYPVLLVIFFFFQSEPRDGDMYVFLSPTLFLTAPLDCSSRPFRTKTTISSNSFYLTLPLLLVFFLVFFLLFSGALWFAESLVKLSFSISPAYGLLCPPFCNKGMMHVSFLLISRNNWKFFPLLSVPIPPRFLPRLRGNPVY